MGLFRSKKDKQGISDVVAEAHRAQDLAAQATSQVEQRLGMSVQDLGAQASAMMQSGEMGKMQAYAARSARLFQVGVEMPATLQEIQLGQANPMLGGVPAQIRVSVEPPGGTAYDVSTEQSLAQHMADGLVAGAHVTVKVDPADPQSLMIWGTAAPAAASAPPTTDERRAKLRNLLDTGVLTQAEYDEQAAKLTS